MSSSRVINTSGVALTAVALLMLSGCGGVQFDEDKAQGVPQSSSTTSAEPTEDMRALGKALDELIDPEDVSDEDHSWANNFASMKYDDGKLELYWVGTPPSRVTDVIAEHPAVTTVIHDDAKYAFDQMEDARLDLVEWIADDHGLGGNTFFKLIATSEDGNSLDAQIDDRSNTWTVAELESTLTDYIGLPVIVSLV